MITETPPKSPSGKSLIDPQALMSIRNLEMRARMVVEGFWSGIHRSPYHGFSVEFTEYRQYSPDDDLRFLDWRVYARSDRYFIKKFEDETNLRCYLVTDLSPSMTYGSLGYTKHDYAATLAATLAYFLYLQGDGVGLLTFDEQIREYLPARHRTGHLRHIMLGLQRPASGKTTNLSRPLRRVAEVVRRRGLVVLISDFLAPLEQLEGELLALAACGHELVVFQLLDPAEVNFTFSQSSMFEDLESGRTLFIEPGIARQEYLKNMADHCAQLQQCCQRLGGTFHRVETDRALELVLFDFLRGRMQQKTTRRTRKFVASSR
jgi:uncharacterized protein (DUF58 family)